MQRPLLYFEKIKIWGIGVLIFYIILSVEFLFFLRLAKSETQHNYLTLYAVGGQLLLYGLLYKSLRNFKVYLFWLTIGLLHLCLYFILKENASLISFHSNTVIGLRNTIILIILFQLLRLISLRAQNQELVCVGRSKTDIYDNREYTRIDVVLYTIYIAATFLFMLL